MRVHSEVRREGTEGLRAQGAITIVNDTCIGRFDAVVQTCLAYIKGGYVTYGFSLADWMKRNIRKGFIALHEIFHSKQNA